MCVFFTVMEGVEGSRPSSNAPLKGAQRKQVVYLAGHSVYLPERYFPTSGNLLMLFQPLFSHLLRLY